MKKKNLFKATIFPTITTISKNWPEKIEEVRKLGLKEVCFFPTCLKEKERRKAYRLLRSTKINKIPLVHLRGDVKPEELDYLVENYETRAFNIHSKSEHPLIYEYSRYKNIIYLENVFTFFDEKELNDFGGVCLDLSHLENDRILHKEKFENTKKMLRKYPIGCNHISVVKSIARFDQEEKNIRYDGHTLEDFSELNYLRKYPRHYFSNLIAIELENSIKEQLLAKEYILNILEV